MLTIEAKAEFVELVGQLSPERLYADGERTPAQARRLEQKLLKDWKALETRHGQKVSQDEAEDFYADVLKHEQAKRQSAMDALPSHPSVTKAIPGVWKHAAVPSVYYIHSAPHVPISGYRVYSEFADRITGKELFGVFGSLDEAIEQIEKFLGKVTPDMLRKALPQWSQDNIDRLRARLPQKG